MSDNGAQLLLLRDICEHQTLQLAVQLQDCAEAIQDRNRDLVDKILQLFTWIMLVLILLVISL